ncbi:hypothetical protein [Xenorhabdus bovienii]|uniref:hypothetical protein n=1 Tax=Xenorhabdus bovienii TaxID=40576 RepID=UPI0023B2B2D1|nr:hypothetical protein [Xenorhabdus bovienii]MDE9544155.1 hypothetical protein [Xenorhabdus bovienii]
MFNTTRVENNSNDNDIAQATVKLLLEGHGKWVTLTDCYEQKLTINTALVISINDSTFYYFSGDEVREYFLINNNEGDKLRELFTVNSNDI